MKNNIDGFLIYTVLFIMANNFVHFTSYKKQKTIKSDRIDDFQNMIEDAIRKIHESGEKSGQIRLELPENLSSDEAFKFIEEVMKRFRGNNE